MLLMTNVDNINADQIPYIIEELMEQGAGNVHVVNAFTKKGRQEYIFLIDVAEDKGAHIAGFLACELGTLGVRILKTEHMSFDYFMKSVKVKLKSSHNQLVWEGDVNVKVVKDKYGEPISARVEYEDLKKAAKSIKNTGLRVSFYELKQMIETKIICDLRKQEHKVEFEL